MSEVLPYRSPRANVAEFVLYHPQNSADACAALVSESDGNGSLGLLVFAPGNIQGFYRRGVRHRDNPHTSDDAKRVVGTWSHPVKSTQPTIEEVQREVAELAAKRQEIIKEETKVVESIHKWWNPEVEKEVVDARHEGLSPGEIGQLVWGTEITKQQGVWRVGLILEKYGLSSRQLKEASEAKSVSAASG